MDDDRFAAELHGLTAELRARRGPCPEPDRLARHALGELTGELAAETAAHLQLCDDCRQLAETVGAEPPEMDDLSWRRVERRLDSRPAPWRRVARRSRSPVWWSLAATALLVVGLSYWSFVDRGPSAPIATTRGAPVQPLEPIGEVAVLKSFRWQAPPLAVVYRVEIHRGEELVWSGSAEGKILEPPAELRRVLLPEIGYSWRVVGVDAAGDVVVTSRRVDLRLLSGD